MSRKTENRGFSCQQCGCAVEPLTNGSCRNHCPECLYSKHLDLQPGDRLSSCHGLMEPEALTQRSGKGLQIVHRCQRCGERQSNRVATDTLQPDDWDLVVRLSATALLLTVDRETPLPVQIRRGCRRLRGLFQAS